MSNMLGRITATNPTMTAGIPGELNIRAISLWHDGAIYCQDQNAMSNFSRQTNSIDCFLVTGLEENMKI